MTELDYILFLPKITRFKIGEGKRITSTHYSYPVDFKRGNNWFSVVLQIICEKAPYTPSIKGFWGVNPISFLRLDEKDSEILKDVIFPAGKPKSRK